MSLPSRSRPLLCLTSVVAALALAGCQGTMGDLPGDGEVLAFAATALVLPEVPRPGQSVSVTLEVTSASNVVVRTDLEMLVVDGAGRQVGYRAWTGVEFHPEEVWNLSDDFLPPTDAFEGDWRLQLTVRDALSGDTLLSLPELKTVAAKSRR